MGRPLGYLCCLEGRLYCIMTEGLLVGSSIERMMMRGPLGNDDPYHGGYDDSEDLYRNPLPKYRISSSSSIVRAFAKIPPSLHTLSVHNTIRNNVTITATINTHLVRVKVTRKTRCFPHYIRVQHTHTRKPVSQQDFYTQWITHVHIM